MRLKLGYFELQDLTLNLKTVNLNLKMGDLNLKIGEQDANVRVLRDIIHILF